MLALLVPGVGMGAGPDGGAPAPLKLLPVVGVGKAWWWFIVLLAWSAGA